MRGKFWGSLSGILLLLVSVVAFLLTQRTGRCGTVTAGALRVVAVRETETWKEKKRKPLRKQSSMAQNRI